MSDYAFEQLVNIRQVEELLEAYFRISGIPCGLMDTDDNIIIGVGLQEACTVFHWNHPIALGRCWRNDPDTKASLHIQTDDLFECHCKNGMVNIAMPVIIEGKRLGVFFSGQFFYEEEPPNLNRFRQQAEELGFDSEPYLAAVHRIPVLSRSHVDSTMRFLHRLVQLLAETGHANRQRLHYQEEQKRTERELLLLNRVVDVSSEALFLMNDQGRFVYVNDTACRSLGYSRSELLTMTPLDIDPDITPTEFGKLLSGLFAVGPTGGYIEARHRTRDGNVFPVELSAKAIDFDGNRFGLVVARDITERKRLQNQLAEQEQQFRTLAENIPNLIVRYDTQLRRTYVNPAWEKASGLSAAEVINVRSSDIPSVPSPVNRDYITKLQRVLATGTDEKIEFDWVNARGERLFLEYTIVPEYDLKGQITGLLATGHDLTEHKRTEESLKESEERFRLLVELSPDLIFIRHREQIIYANPAAVRISRATHAEELIGRSVLDFGRPERRDNLKTLLAANDATPVGTVMPPYEATLVRLDGTTVPVEITAVRLQYRGMECSQQIMRDITERKWAEQLTLSRLRILEITNQPQISLHDSLRLMLDEIESLTNSTIAFYHFLDRDQQTLSLQGWSTQTLTGICKAEVTALHYSVAMAGVWADAVRERRPLIHNDYASFPNRQGMPEGHTAVSRELIVPIFRGGSIVAIIGVGNKPTDYTDSDLQIVSLLGDTAWEIVTRKQAEDRIKIGEREFRTLAENSPDNIVRYDTNCRMIYLNPRMEKTLGIPAADLLGKTPSEKPPGPERGTYQERIKQVLITGEEAEIDLILPDTGEGKRHHHIRFVAERDDAGAVAGVLAIGRDITERKLAEQILYEKQQRINDMALELTISEERERQRLAADLHDTLGQDLTLTRMKLSCLRKNCLSSVQNGLADELDNLIETAIKRVRGMTRLLSPPILESAGLEAALKWLARQLEADYHLNISFFDDQQNKPVSREFQQELYHCVRELLINVAKHAEAGTVCLSIGREDNLLAIQVEDDGMGFNTDRTLTCQIDDGFGLVTIERRVKQMHGSFTITSRPGSGTEVTITVPLAKQVALGTTQGKQS